MNAAEKIKEIRTSLNLTQKEFADRIGKSVVSLRNYESGKTQPGEDVLEKISKMAGEAETVAEIETKKTLRKGGRKAKEKIEEAAVKTEDLTESITANEIEVKKTVRKGSRKAKEKIEEAVAKAEDMAEVITANEIEVKKAVRKGGHKAKAKVEEVSKEAAKAVEPVKEAAVPVIEKAKKAVKPAVKKAGGAAEKATKKVKKAAKKSAPSIIIESLLGGQITIEDISKRLPKNIEKVYIKPEENKAYWVNGDESGEIELW